MTATTTQVRRAADLYIATSTPVAASMVISICDQLEALQLALETERAAANLYAKQVAHWIEKHDALLAQQLEVAESRDAYAEAADTMAAAHKVERDALKDAARLALDSLERLLVCSDACTCSGREAIAALEAVL